MMGKWNFDMTRADHDMLDNECELVEQGDWVEDGAHWYWRHKTEDRHFITLMSDPQSVWTDGILEVASEEEAREYV